ncbi:MAG: helix-turn-helix domain-containing protein [Candidatus Electrothrix sp.]
MKPLGLSQNKLALALHVPARRINEIVLGRRGISADTSLRRYDSHEIIDMRPCQLGKSA